LTSKVQALQYHGIYFTTR